MVKYTPKCKYPEDFLVIGHPESGVAFLHAVNKYLEDYLVISWELSSHRIHLFICMFS